VVTLTAAGHTVTAETRRLREEWFSRHLALLSSEERAQLLAVTDILRKLAES
jgi:DNA-binding MarR family transcriptional regulator